MRIPLVAGRLFTEQDLRTQPRVTIVDEYMANQLWPGGDPIGKRLRLGADATSGAWVTVVGVVGRVKQDRLDSESRMAMYFAHTQFPTRAMNVVLRTATTDPARIVPEAAAAIRAARLTLRFF